MMREFKGRMLRNISGSRGAEVARRSRKLEDDLFVFFLLSSNYSTYLFNVLLCLFGFLCFLFLFSIFVFCFVYSVFLYCFCIFWVWFLLLCCLFPVFEQVYRPMPPSGNPIAANKYRIPSYECS